MDIIHLLPDRVANQIAAGEVIQRPASCLKELVENSLDAGATRIQIIIRDAGRTLLQVIDNGKGMSETDARMAFERHATSKIKEAADLFHLMTMGFRGEALASICAVAQVEVTTRRSEDEVGTHLIIHGSQVISQTSEMCAVGTNIQVKNLFYNIPVRRKFLKTDQTELRNLLVDFYRIVLVYPQIQFTFVHNDEIILELLPGTEKQRIEQIFGKSNRQPYTGQLVDIKAETELVNIHGFIGKPEVAGKNAQEYFFVNGRYMRHPLFHKAVMTAYAGLLKGEVNPSYFIYFDINPESIDVNIHPTKTEIKFADEQPVFQILMATIREALGKFNVSPSLDFDRSGYIEMPSFSAKDSLPSSIPIQHNTDYNPFRQHTPSVPDHGEQLYTTPIAEKQPLQEQQQLLFESDFLTSNLYQYGGRYILFPGRQGLLLVDQHRAHACVLYAQYKEQLLRRQAPTQQLLFPEIWELSAEDENVLETMLMDLHCLGFDLSQFAPRQYSINGVPSMLEGKNPIAVLTDILAEVKESGITASEQVHQKMAMTLAWHTAIPYGKILTKEEMEHLIGQLIDLGNYRYTPDGKTVVSILSDDDIAQKFKKNI